MAALDAGDQHDAGDDQQAEQDFERPDAALLQQRLGEGGEQRDGGHAGQADGDIRQPDRAEEAQPMGADDHPDPEERASPPPAGPHRLPPDGEDPGRRGERGDPGPPEHQPRRAEGDEFPEHRRRRQQEDQEMELEVEFQEGRASEDVPLLEERDQFLDPEVGQHFAVPVERGRFRLAGEVDHLLHRLAVAGDDLDLHGDLLPGEVVDDVVAPRAAGLDVEDGEVGHGDGSGETRDQRPELRVESRRRGFFLSTINLRLSTSRSDEADRVLLRELEHVAGRGGDRGVGIGEFFAVELDGAGGDELLAQLAVGFLQTEGGLEGVGGEAEAR